MEELFQASGTRNQEIITILIPDKVDFKLKKFPRDKGHYFNQWNNKSSKHYNLKHYIYIYTHNFIKIVLLDLKRHTRRLTPIY